MESAFDKILKGASDEQVANARGFVDRVTTGDPMQGFDDNDISRITSEVLPNLSPAELQQAMKQSVQNLSQNMSATDRSALGEMMKQREAGQGLVDITRAGESVPAGTEGATGGGGGGGIDDLLGGLLGGAGGGNLDDILGGLLGGGGSGQTGAQSDSGGGGLGGMLGGLLGGLLGGGGGGGGASQQSGATDAAPDISGMLGDLMNSPMGKSIIAGAGAFAMKNILDKK